MLIPLFGCYPGGFQQVWIWLTVQEMDGNYFWISVLTPLSSQFNNCQHKVPGEYQTSSCWCLLHSNLAVTYITNSQLGTFLALCEVDMLVSPCECRPAHLFSDRVDKQNDWLQNWKNVWSKQAGHRPSTIPGRSIGAVVVNVVIKDGDDQKPYGGGEGGPSFNIVNGGECHS